MESKLFLVLLACLIGTIECSFWTTCPGGIRGPRDVTSPSCSGSHCTGVRGENIVLRVTSDFVETHPTLTLRAYVVILGVTIQIPDDPRINNVCPLLQENGNPSGCPARPNTIYTWTLDMEIPRTIPAFQNGRIRVQLLDANRVVQCFDVIGTMV